VTATSPDYPKSLTGQAFLVGNLVALQLVLVFPSPFQLTLVGTVNIQTNATTFTGLPDIPLTNLQVTLFSGPNGLFAATCAPASGTASADLTDQNGDKTVHAPNNFTVTGCTPGSGGSGGGNGGNGGGTGNGSTAAAKFTKGSFAGLASGHPSLHFTVGANKGAAGIRRLVVELPRGLRFVRHHGSVSGVSLVGAKIKSLALSHGHLVITLKKAVRSLTVRIGAAAIAESGSLKSRAKAKTLGRLALTVIADSTGGAHTTIRAKIT
jgi:hypothetical protein